MEELEKKLNYKFKDIKLFQTALTHSSYANENKRLGAVCNERLEFLGDAVLGFITAGYLYSKFPNMPEGKMTRIRAELVCEKSLDAVAAELELGKYLLLGKGEENSGGRKRPSIIADAVEALLAALYIDGGLDIARQFVNVYILKPFEKGMKELDRDYKTELQEIVQRKSGQTLEYRLSGETGPDHAKSFEVNVIINGKEISSGTGRSKKDAEQAAAKKALEVMK